MGFLMSNTRGFYEWGMMRWIYALSSLSTVILLCTHVYHFGVYYDLDPPRFICSRSGVLPSLLSRLEVIGFRRIHNYGKVGLVVVVSFFCR